MKRFIISASIIIAVLIMITAFKNVTEIEDNWTEKTSVQKVLSDLGNTKSKHFIVPDERQIKKGEEIVKNGFTTNKRGGKTRRVSKHYVCTSCHNVQREDPILTKHNPEARLKYVKEHKIPFLQGTTFWGITNRESWYNDDYVNKYGAEAIGKARDDLRAATQLCAVECAQGRKMKDWEIEAVLAYFTSLELKMSDLDLSKKDWAKLKDNSINKVEKITFLKSKYATKSPAHFYDSPKSKKEGYPNTKKGNIENGKNIYDLSCKYCHQGKNAVSHLLLDDTQLSLQYLKRKMLKNTHLSIYQIIPYGTYAIPGHKPYMPHYPLERMSLQQVEDLRAYIEQQTIF